MDAVTTYNITYSDAISGDECGSHSIAAASCNSGMCSHVFEVPSHQSNCNSDINVTVLADNLVQSEPIKIGTVTSLLYSIYVPFFHLLYKGRNSKGWLAIAYHVSPIV